MSMQQSLSLPRIRPSDTSIQRSQSLKFKKLPMDHTNPQSISPTLKPSRSVVVGLSRQSRNNLKSQKLYMSIIEKKVREGSYDEKEEVGLDLEGLKRRCSDIRNQIATKNIEIERVRKLIEETRGQIAVYENDVGAVRRNIEERRRRYEGVRGKVEEAAFDRSRLITMIKDRKADNVILNARVESTKYELSKLQRHLSLLTKSQMQIKDKDNIMENEYRSAIITYQHESKEMKKKLDGEEQKMQRITQNDIMRDERKKKMIEITASVEKEEKQREFLLDHNGFLANRVLNRFLEDKMNRMMDGSEKIRYLFRQITESYGPFPATQFAKKFSNQEPEKQKITQQIKAQEQKFAKLQQQNKSLKKLSSDLQIESMALTEDIDSMGQQSLNDTPELTQKSNQADSKLKIIGLWSERNLKILQQRLAEKKNWTQNIKGEATAEKLLKILSHIQTQMISDTTKSSQNQAQ